MTIKVFLIVFLLSCLYILTVKSYPTNSTLISKCKNSTTCEESSKKDVDLKLINLIIHGTLIPRNESRTETLNVTFMGFLITDVHGDVEWQNGTGTAAISNGGVGYNYILIEFNIPAYVYGTYQYNCSFQENGSDLFDLINPEGDAVIYEIYNDLKGPNLDLLPEVKFVLLPQNRKTEEHRGSYFSSIFWFLS